MYCPKCGQAQPSEEIRFCSRCGLPLFVLAEWLARGGASALRIVEPQNKKPSVRRRGSRRWAKFMFFSAVLLPIAFGVAVAEGEPALFFIPLAVFVAGLVWMIYSRLFGEVSEALTHQKPEEVKGSGEWRSLPPMHIDGIAGSRTQRVDTAEMLQPPSVTERTTNLLRKE